MDPSLAQVENRLEQLIARLLAGAEAAFLAGDIESARASAEEIRAVSPEDRGAIDLLERVTRSQRPPEGERVLMTVLFSDLVDSTALAERVDPEVVRDILMVYRDAATTAVERFGGRVLQWLGDGVLAVVRLSTGVRGRRQASGVCGPGPRRDLGECPVGSP